MSRPANSPFCSSPTWRPRSSATRSPGPRYHTSWALKPLIPKDKSCAPYPFPHLYDATIHSTSHTDRPLPDILWVVADGALTATTLGGGVVLYHPQMGILQTFHFVFLVFRATSADAEWLPTLVARFLLRRWTGQAFFFADATTSMHCAFTKAPPSTTTNHLFRELVTCAVGFQEYWLQSQHTTGHTHPSAALLREAHALAARGAAGTMSFTAPLLPLLSRATLATSEGRLLFNV